MNLARFHTLSFALIFAMIFVMFQNFDKSKPQDFKKIDFKALPQPVQDEEQSWFQKLLPTSVSSGTTAQDLVKQMVQNGFQQVKNAGSRSPASVFVSGSEGAMGQIENAVSFGNSQNENTANNPNAEQKEKSLPIFVQLMNRSGLSTLSLGEETKVSVEMSIQDHSSKLKVRQKIDDTGDLVFDVSPQSGLTTVNLNLSW